MFDMKNTMNFGDAIAALKEGKKVARQYWNEKGTFLFLTGGYIDALPTICMKTADNKVLKVWLPRQTDMLSEDWMIVE